MTSGARSYLIINIIFAGVVIVILSYSAVFSPEKNRYPVQCVHERLSGQPCPSCGLSHSLSYIIRGDIDNAFVWNRYGLRVFLFFLIQLIMRISLSISIFGTGSTTRSMVRYDVVLSSLSFLLAFNQFILYYINILFSASG